MNTVPDDRIRDAHGAPIDENGDYALYWMIANRRTAWNFSLQRAVEWGRQLRKPLVIFEPLRTGYRWASDRLHSFVIQGMADNAKRLSGEPALYYPYLEPEPGAGRGMLRELARRACVVVSDDFPCFFLPRMLKTAAEQIPVRFELIDSNGLLPMKAAEKVYRRAYDFRRFLQRNLPPHLNEMPAPDPLAGARLPKIEALPTAIARKWPAADVERLATDPHSMEQFPIDHDVAVSPIPGGTRAAVERLREFINTKLQHYGARNVPDQDVASGLSPYLHFGHIAAHQIFMETVEHDGWTKNKIAAKASGSARGWWGASEAVESFFDELITWRELGFNLCSRQSDYHRYESLPDWAKLTLAEHERDPREHVYSREEFEAAATHDELWNAAGRQLVREGRIHNYLRMLWGKKILEWTASPRDALDVMIELNNKYALDGRDPNSYSGIFWVLGRYDRAWGPERPVFGKIRYMSSENTARKLAVKGYLKRYAKDGR